MRSSSLPAARAVGIVLVAVLCVLGITLRPYGGSPTALFHLDQKMAAAHPVPAGFVVLKVPGYDGEQYYQIARSLWQITKPADWPVLASQVPPGSYAYQRFLLPLVAGALSFGSDAVLPWVFLLINIVSLCAVTALMLRAYPKALLPALMLGLGPAAMVGLHFSLSEPLTLLVITAALLRMEKMKKLEWGGAVLLAAAMLAREIDILLLLGVIGWLLVHRRWKELPWALIPLFTWLGLHSLIFGIFHEIPFLMSTAKNTVPLGAIAALLMGKLGRGMPAVSSALLLLAFVLPAFLWTIREIYLKRKKTDMETAALLGFLCVMILMPSFIWAAITSIGRVITPVYPLFAIVAARKHTTFLLSLCTLLIVLGVVTALGLAWIVHPFSPAA